MPGRGAPSNDGDMSTAQTLTAAGTAQREPVEDAAEIIVRTSALTKRYGQRVAVAAVELTVRRGEIYGFLGPNGAGKTTTLRMLLGLIRPTSGSAQVLGHPAGARAVASRIGALIEGPGFYPYLSGRRNLGSLARQRGLDDAAVERVLRLVDLEARGDDRFKTYSLGMKQRLGVAAALLGNPDLVILDEPTNGLDPSGMADMRTLIVRLAGMGHTVILSSHMLAEVQEICDRVGVIADGTLLRESTVAALLGDPMIIVRGEPLQQVVRVAQRIAGDAGCRVDGPDVVLDLAPDRAPDVVRELVAAQVEVHWVRPVERTLEEVFFELTINERNSR